MSGGGKNKGFFVTLYFMSIHMVIARYIDELVEIQVDKKRLWRGSATSNTNLTHTSRWLFGGDSKEGGIWGWSQLRMGEKDQVNEGLMKDKLGHETAFRGVASLFYYGEVCANSPSPRPWRFRVRHHERGWRFGWLKGRVWYQSKIAIWQAEGQVKAMNPAHIMRMLWVHPDFRGLSESKLDEAAWIAFADKLYEEGFGLCFKPQGGIGEFMAQILDHVGGAQYVSRHTGKIVPVLVRDDYDRAALPLFTPDTGLLGIDEYGSDALSGAINEVLVNYKDVLDEGKKKQVREQNLGSINALGGNVNSITLDYPGIATAALARRVARRELFALSGFVRRFKIRLDRRATRYAVPAGLIKISDPERGIESMVLRLGRVESGSFKAGTIVIDAALDVFSMPDTVYIDEEPNGHVPPNPNPTPIIAQRLIEAPYRDLVGLMGAPMAEALEPESGFLGAVAIKPSPLSSEYILNDRVAGVSGDYIAQAKGLFCPAALLVEDIAELDQSIVLTASEEFMVLSKGGAALLGDEIVYIAEVDALASTITVARGCADTVPAKHPAGTRVWFYDSYTVADLTEYSAGVELEVKLQPEAIAGQLPLDEVTPELFTMSGRAARPYPPGQLKINDKYYPDAVPAGSIEISWAHRNRLLQAEHLIDTTQASTTPEANTTYTARLLRVNPTIVVEELMGVEGTHATFNVSVNGSYKLEVLAMRDGLESWQKHEVYFEVTEGEEIPDTIIALTSNDLATNSVVDVTGRIWSKTEANVTDDYLFGGVVPGLKFNGVNNQLVKTVSTTDLDIGGDDFTFELWVRFDSVPSSGHSTLLQKGSTLTRGYMIGTFARKFFVQIGDGSDVGADDKLLNMIIQPNTDYHIAGTVKGKTLYLHINGIKAGEKTFTREPSPTTDDLIIGTGAGRISSETRFRGRVGQVRITREALYSKDIEPIPIIPF